MSQELTKDEAAKKYAKGRWPDSANEYCIRNRGYSEYDFKAGADWQANQTNNKQGMKWIDCNDRLPTKAAEYFVMVDDYKAVAIFVDNHFFSNDDLLPVTKWLDEY